MLKKFCLMSRNNRKYLSEDPEEIMHEVQRIVQQQRARSEGIYKQLLKELKAQNIYILHRDDLNLSRTNMYLNTSTTMSARRSFR